MTGSGLAFYAVALVLLGGAVWWTRARADESAVATVSAGRLPAVLLAAAFLVMAVRAVLMVRWPLLASDATSTSGAWPGPAGLPHHLVVALVLFTVGLFAAATGRGPRAVGRGLTVMLVAAAVALASVVRFVGGQGDENLLVMLVVAASAATTWLSRRIVAGRLAARNEATADSAGSVAAAERSPLPGVPATVLVVLAGVTLALLAGAW